ncbi:MAG TPA: MmcQ/YjbR family DNA-binding protein [Candidatus Dormibacteraeota bacterium]|nr:MmcQ/YjbR family DNA-binding protein [Candidatus Dormibacteraeota bacterium]
MTVEDAARLALALPEVSEGTRFGHRTWLVAGKGFAWERPLSKADVKRLGDQPAPEGPLLAVRVGNLEEKEVLMMDPPHGFFDIEHFRGYPAVLIRLQLVEEDVLKAALVEAWHACAPPSLAAVAPPRSRRRPG